MGPAEDDADPAPPGAELRTHTLAGGALWQTQTPALALWKGEVGLTDWLRIEQRDGRIEELRVEPRGGRVDEPRGGRVDEPRGGRVDELRGGRVDEPRGGRVDEPRGGRVDELRGARVDELRGGRVDELRGELRLGRRKPGMLEPPDIAHERFVSSQAATLRHDGARWWLRRRPECHEKVPTVVGATSLRSGEEAPLVHGTFVQVGQVRATFVDRRYVAPLVPAGAVDPDTGLLARVGFEHEIASRLAIGDAGALIIVAFDDARDEARPASLALHASFPRAPVLHERGTTALLTPTGDAADWAERVAEALQSASLPTGVVGYWPLGSAPLDAAKELELALAASASARDAIDRAPLVALRTEALAPRMGTAGELASVAREGRRTVVLFALEETLALGAIGADVVRALERELSAVAAAQLGRGALVARLAPGVVGAALAPGADAEVVAIAVQREWHARPPIADGQVELPRTLCWRVAIGEPEARAEELSRECEDPHGVLHALAGGLPYPIAGRVALAASAGSAVERVKLLFDVLEGAWRFVANVLAAAYFAAPASQNGSMPEGWAELVGFARAHATRHGLALGAWRELARLCARGFAGDDDPIGRMTRDLLRVRRAGPESLDAIADQLHPARNRFAHSVYPEARAQQDVAAFEQAAREFLRALRPLCAWTLVTIEKSDPELYGDMQVVEYIDHTGPAEAGTRRRVGWRSPARLANVVYLVRWREGLAIPLEPFVRRRSRGHAFDLFWLASLPQSGACLYSAAVHGAEATFEIDPRRLAPRLRTLLGEAGAKG